MKMYNQENTDDQIQSETLLRYLRGVTSPQENTIIEKWINENPENEKTALQIGQIYYAQYTGARIKSYNPYLAFEKNKLRRRNLKVKRILTHAGISAACAALIIIILLPFLSPKAAPPVETQYITISTNPGMRANFNLPDGTLIHLNSASKLVYPIPFDPKERRVCLEGEAYFEVESNKEHPFLVSVSNDKMRVKVTGTKFNVTAYPGEEKIYTTLVEGSVNVQITDAFNKTRTQILNDTVKELVYTYNGDNPVIAQQPLQPSQKVTYTPSTRKMTFKTVVSDYEHAWKDGKLIFKDTPIPEVLQKMSNYYNVKFIIKDPVIESYRFTGTFQHKQLSQVLDYLQLTNKIKYTIQTITEDDSNGINHTVILLEKKE